MSTTLKKISECPNDFGDVSCCETEMGCTTYSFSGLDCCGSKDVDTYFWRFLKRFYKPKNYDAAKLEETNGWNDYGYDHYDHGLPAENIIIWSGQEGKGGHQFAKWLQKHKIGKIVISDPKKTTNHGTVMRGFVWCAPKSATFEQLWATYGRRRKRK